MKPIWSIKAIQEYVEEKEHPFRPEGYHQCYLALEALQIGNDITPTDYKTIQAMLDSSDQENLAMAEMALWKKYEGITIKIKK